MNYKKFKLLSWNVRGLGLNEKCNVVRNIIKNARCEVVLLQETKCNSLELSQLFRFLPSFFSLDVAYNLTINSARGILIAWRRSIRLIKSCSTKHTVSALLQRIDSGHLFWVTNAYGPTDDTFKPAFIEELHCIATLTTQPWILAGDFNLTRWLVDRSTMNHNFALMDLFNQLITDMGVLDISLKNRCFT